MRFTLSASEHAAVLEAARSTRDKRHWQRLRALLLLAEGRTITDVARSLGATRQSIYNWVGTFEGRRDPWDLADSPRSGRPPVLGAPEQERLDQLMRTEPAQHGYRAHG